MHYCKQQSAAGHIQIPIFLFQSGDELCSKSSLILGEKTLSQQYSNSFPSAYLLDLYDMHPEKYILLSK